MKISKPLAAGIAVAACAGAALPAAADPALFLGAAFRFGGSAPPAFGVTAKVLSNDEPDEVVLALGATWYPGQTQKFGADLSVGYTFDDGAVTAGWDFLSGAPVLGLGWADIQSDDDEEEDVVVSPPSEEPDTGGGTDSGSGGI